MRSMPPPDTVPEYVTRRYRRLAPVGFAVALGPQLAIIAGQIFWPAGPSGWGSIRFSFAMVALAILAVAALLVLTARWERRLIDRIAEFDGRLCPHCAYPLPGRRGKAVCPECGTACAVEEVEQAWHAFRPRLGRLRVSLSRRNRGLRGSRFGQ